MKSSTLLTIGKKVTIVIGKNKLTGNICKIEKRDCKNYYDVQIPIGVNEYTNLEVEESQLVCK